MTPDELLHKRFHRVHDNKRYFMSQRQMREDKWYQSIMHSRIKRGYITGAIGVTSGNRPCSCGCGTLATVIYREEPLRVYDFYASRNKKTKRLTFWEKDRKIVK